MSAVSVKPTCNETSCACKAFLPNAFKRNLCCNCMHDCVSHEGTTPEQQALATLARANNIPSVVDEGLLMGSMLAAMNVTALQQAHVTHVVNCAKGLSKTWPKFKQFPDKFTYLNLELNDDSSNSILGCMPRALEFIDNARKNGGAVFVHCAQGVSRSGSIVVGYLMKSRDLSFTDALCFARKGHPICQPNSYFKQEMQTKEAWIRSGCKTSL